MPAHIKQFINKAFHDIADRYSADLVVEKTCANSLRVPFVDAVLPDAKYILSTAMELMPLVQRRSVGLPK